MSSQLFSHSFYQQLLTITIVNLEHLTFETMPGIHQQLAAADPANGCEQRLMMNSALAQSTLSLWMVGRLSARGTQQLAAAAIADGCQHTDLALVASVGGWVFVPGNCSRDLKGSSSARIED